MKKRCKAICKNGNRCYHPAIICGYCTIHFKLKKVEVKK